MCTKPSEPMRALLCLAALVAVAPACARAGTARGVAVDDAGRPEPITFDWQSNTRGSEGRIAVTMPEGDAFSGRFYQTKERVDVSSFDPLRPSAGPDYEDVHEVRATLTNGEGKSMRCAFILQRPEVGVRGGGIGNCRTSDGRVVDGAVLTRR